MRVRFHPTNYLNIFGHRPPYLGVDGFRYLPSHLTLYPATFGGFRVSFAISGFSLTYAANNAVSGAMTVQLFWASLTRSERS